MAADSLKMPRLASRRLANVAYGKLSVFVLIQILGFWPLKTALWYQPAREAQRTSAPLFGKATPIPAIWDGVGCIDFAGFDGTLSEAKDSGFEVYASP
ncbi:hypothetical protein [Qipengyuania sp. NPDC077563]|uniref:hypothetical protein n=1 Tax=Qipengyuania sp. NPDC077563 TaxID=3364497 RepID=UPI00384D0D59